jgi:signal transduction histidine kinase
MLGQQQIAGVPTAISELFKNAHDAYAHHVEVDYFRSDGLFILRDDGIGMTKQDFEERWLVLGTESKVAGAPLGPPYKPQSADPRPILGEKGIGRLAVGAVGPQVLVLSRAIREHGLEDLVAAFINWSFFALPGVHLDDIEIPLRTFPGGTVPDRTAVAAMVEEAFDAFAAIQRRGIEVPEAISNDLARFSTDVIPADLAQSLEGPSLLGQGHGTQFFVLPTTSTLATDIDAGRTTDAAPPLTKFLIGFTNTMTPAHSTPLIEARFRDWRSNEVPDELIAESEFFTPEEFHDADHHVAGRFDEFGQFDGTVAIYGQEPVAHRVPWPDARGRATDCGPFRLQLAVVQGQSNETRLDPESWAHLTAKMARIGGLYLYRDGIRVLPYGNNDYDFIDIERNRTKNAARYYFSYRRMFGVIELDSTHNGALKEKAGREGFRENPAYRQFRQILMNFFVQTAADFFREEGTASDAFQGAREEYRKADAARQRREKLRSARKREFQSELGERLSWIEEGRPALEVASVVAAARADLAAVEQAGSPEDAAAAFVEAEVRAKRSLDRVRDGYRLRLPGQTGLGRQTRVDWDGFRSCVARLDEEVFGPAQEQVAEMLSAAAAAMNVAVDRRVRLERGVTESSATARTRARSEAAAVTRSLDQVTASTLGMINDALRELEMLTVDAQSESASMPVAELDEGTFERRRRDIEQRVLTALDTRTEQFQQLALRLDAITRAAVEDDLADVEALEQDELISLRERADTDLELMQLGTAISVINHEFLGNVRSLRSNLRRLKAWADKNEGLARVYRDLRASFDHLDGYLTLFTPLQRRLHRTAVPIIGTEIEKFVRDLFDERLHRHDVTLDVTPRFRDHRLTSFPSTIYPVFVNLIDNSIWWVKDRSPRVVMLQARDGVMSVIDSGPGISDHDSEAIFELGFTRKPAGRGTGLYVARQVLRREGFDLIARNDDTEGLGGAAFDIVPLVGATNGDT